AEERPTDISTDEHVAACRDKHLAEQAGGGAFARASRHAHDGRRAQVKEQLHQAAQPNTTFARRAQELVLGWHTGRGVDHDDLVDIGNVVAAEAARRAGGLELSDRVLKLIRWL